MKDLSNIVLYHSTISVSISISTEFLPTIISNSPGCTSLFISIPKASSFSAMTKNLTVSVSKAEIKNNRAIVRFELGEYWIEKSYDYDLADEGLSDRIETDRLKWIKKIAKRFLEIEQQEEIEQLTNITGEYDV